MCDENTIAIQHHRDKIQTTERPLSPIPLPLRDDDSFTVSLFWPIEDLIGIIVEDCDEGCRSFDVDCVTSPGLPWASQETLNPTQSIYFLPMIEGQDELTIAIGDSRKIVRRSDTFIETFLRSDPSENLFEAKITDRWPRSFGEFSPALRNALFFESAINPTHSMERSTED